MKGFVNDGHVICWTHASQQQ